MPERKTISDLGKTITAGSNIGFKVGSSTNLKNFKPFGNTDAVEGCFYLTSDTHQLYVGNSDHTLSPVNEGIITVATLDDLPNLTDVSGSSNPSQALQAYTGHFYYVISEGVLTVFNGSKWVLVNPDTNIHQVKEGFHATASSGIVDLKHTSVDSEGDNYTSGVKFTGAGNISVSVSASPADMSQVTGNTSQSNDPTVTITGKEYKIDSTAGTAVTGQSGAYQSVDINYKENTANAAVLSSVTLQADSNITLKKDTENSSTIKISAQDTTVESVTARNATSGTGFEFLVTDSKGDSTDAAKIDPEIVYGGTQNAQSTVKFSNGTATLDVYSTTEVDDKMKALNAMTYRGTVGTGGTFATKFGKTANDKYPYNGTTQITNISVGDTFLACSEIGPNDSFNGSTIPSQALIIARGTEDKQTGYITASTLTYDVVTPTANTDTHYYLQGSQVTTGSGQNEVQTGVLLKVKGDRGPTADNNGYNGYVQISKGNDDIVISSSSTTNTNTNGDSEFTNSQTEITVSHKAYGTPTVGSGITQSTVNQPMPTDEDHDKDTAITAITGLELSNGHITGYTTTTYNVNNSESYISTYGSTTSAQSSDNKVVGLKTNITEVYGSTDTRTLTSTSVVKSNTLNLTPTSATASEVGGTGPSYGVQIDLVWGSF